MDNVCMSEIKPGATVLNIAAKCPKCQTTFTQETNVYDLAVRQLTERAEKAEEANRRIDMFVGSMKTKAVEINNLLAHLEVEKQRAEKAEATHDPVLIHAKDMVVRLKDSP